MTAKYSISINQKNVQKYLFFSLIATNLVVSNFFTKSYAKIEKLVTAKSGTTALQTFFPANNGFIGATSREFLYKGATYR
jgi:hypothetical protein